MTYQSHIKNIAGKKTKKIFLFTLSTSCVWCKKTKALLNDLGLEYSYVDVDLLEEKDQEEAQKEINKHNPNVSFPTIVINDGEKVIVGFQESEIRNI